MIQKVLVWLARRSVGSKALAALAWANERLRGNRTEILLGLQALIWGLKKVGVIGAELNGPADALAAALLGALPLTLADKAKKAQEVVDSLAPTPEPPAPPAP
mgnify:CR=1 FL=1